MNFLKIYKILVSIKKNDFLFYKNVITTITMTAQNVASLMYDIKDKISDKEFKDIMDALGVVHKNDEKQDVYLFKYYKMKLDVGRFHDGVMGNRLKYKYKETKVVLHPNFEGVGFINRIMNNIKYGINYEFYIKKDRENKENYPELCSAPKTIQTLECMKDATDDDDSVLLEYNEIIPISIEKL